MAFFPTLLSGPILRASQFIPQLSNPVPAWDDSRQAFWLIILGLFKKIVLSSYLSEHATRQLFSSPESFSSLGALVGVMAYSAQIYCDFSGYSDLAQGLAGLLGLRVPDNFRKPYAARNLRQFWQGWHVSLSTWLRDYLYIPLGGSRTSAARRNVNLMVTMGLGGLWHGASLTFLAWGLLHGLGLVVTHAFAGRPASGEPAVSAPAWRAKARDAAAWAATFGFVTLAWVFFASPDFQTALDVLGRIVSCTAQGTGPGLVLTAMVVGVIGRPGPAPGRGRALPGVAARAAGPGPGRGPWGAGSRDRALGAGRHAAVHLFFVLG